MAQPKAEKTSSTIHFITYLGRIMKEKNDDLGMAREVKLKLNTTLLNIVRSIVKKCTHKYLNITVVEIQSVVLENISRSLAKYAIEDATKATCSYIQDRSGGSKTKRAGLIFPPSLMARIFKEHGKSNTKLQPQVAVYLAAIIEFLATEIIVLLGNKAREEYVHRISLTHLNHLFETDEALAETLVLNEVELN